MQCSGVARVPRKSESCYKRGFFQVNNRYTATALEVFNQVQPPIARSRGHIRGTHAVAMASAAAAIPGMTGDTVFTTLTAIPATASSHSPAAPPRMCRLQARCLGGASPC